MKCIRIVYHFLESEPLTASLNIWIVCNAPPHYLPTGPILTPGKMRARICSVWQQEKHLRGEMHRVPNVTSFETCK